ncbi:N6-adenosine-methyltransferase non-catalytic subunit [Diaphorina citri]|uniref:N(6)-adenosine-methyltransferase non-catalytic subunit METTL14 n=1 Tax=Diaphorina citri TaxID=121845 RepID=A0A1S3DF93_DIACI|nr:N6-adenosine-methyltransferase non-catalytic subunit [Diaphorina citri]KAI5712724.1 hypothetical protein M8J75_010729 [Diaphorina citri]KAI5749781.1 hypothetical protein M8J76_010172 [Diaphorina citri]KAI5754106.1 hypothetical protein M8J77_005796 [Diaphorina citri]
MKMSEKLKEIKEKSQKRKKLLAQTFGISDVNNLKYVLGTAEKRCQQRKQRIVQADLEREDGEVYNELVYKDSSTFLKGTQSSNPHNDYCQHFVDTGQRPQNFIRDVGLADRFEEYPKLRELIKLKDDLIAETATPPMFLKCDVKEFNLKELNVKFDVIHIEPPLEEYQRTLGVTNMQGWSWDQIMQLEIGEVAAARSFVFLWCGSSEGLDQGRNCLRKWGFRRCEDICWIRTNASNPGHSKNIEAKAVFQRTKEHCLMGIKGTVRRSTDGDFIHANVDIDLIISEEMEYGSLEKPVEIFHIMEHFCLGRRRLHIFGRDSTIRPGWLTIGPDLTNSNFNAETYTSYFINGYISTGCTERIEALRPKSPPPKNKTALSTRGRGVPIPVVRGTLYRPRGRGVLPR